MRPDDFIARRRTAWERLDKLLAINTRAAYALAQEAWPTMQRQQHGRIVLAASAAIYGLAGSIPYSTAKASYIGLTRGLAREGEAFGITVNLIEPAGATRMAENMAHSEVRDWVLATMRPELVSPLVVALCHASCRTTELDYTYPLDAVDAGAIAAAALGYDLTEPVLMAAAPLDDRRATEQTT